MICGEQAACPLANGVERRQQALSAQSRARLAAGLVGQPVAVVGDDSQHVALGPGLPCIFGSSDTLAAWLTIYAAKPHLVADAGACRFVRSTSPALRSSVDWTSNGAVLCGDVPNLSRRWRRCSSLAGRDLSFSRRPQLGFAPFPISNSPFAGRNRRWSEVPGTC